MSGIGYRVVLKKWSRLGRKEGKPCKRLRGGRPKTRYLLKCQSWPTVTKNDQVKVTLAIWDLAAVAQAQVAQITITRLTRALAIKILIAVKSLLATEAKRKRSKANHRLWWPVAYLSTLQALQKMLASKARDQRKNRNETLKKLNRSRKTLWLKNNWSKRARRSILKTLHSLKSQRAQRIMNQVRKRK